MAITTALVVGLTEAAPLLGARLSGILATFPAYAAILTVFAHRESAAAAVQVLRGLLLGLFSFAAFFVVLAVLLERVGTGPAFLAAGVVTLAVHGLSLRALLPGRGSGRLGRA
jgi:inner membrane protein involved in colicin E2 resistance